MKKTILFILTFVSFFWRIIPSKVRVHFLTFIFVLESRSGNAAKGLRNLLIHKDNLNWVINERALAYGNSVHPKHRLTNYHNFFIERIKDGDSVLDIGCGYGAVARSIAKLRPKSIVQGIDLDRERLSQANDFDNPKNLNFTYADATIDVPKGKWDIIILSNVLEHIEKRVEFLKKIHKTTKSSLFLIRVPLFERDWEIPLRKELKINYFSDDDHKIEHQLNEFYEEINNSGFKISEIKTLWGEIWASCHHKKILTKKK